MIARRLAAIFGASVLFLGAASTAQAQVNRVFVSARSGSDANACGNVNTPCQTFQGAVDQVAAGGAVLVLDTGGYGPITIGKAITIEAPPGIEAFIHPPSGNAITILAGGGDVIVLRGLTLSVGSGFGIDFLIGGALHVEKCVIQGFQGGIFMSREGGTPIFADLYVEDTIIRDCAFAGIGVLSISGTVRATIERTHLVANEFGLDADSNSRVAVWDSVAAGNSTGMSLTARDSFTSLMTIERCTQDSNAVAGVQSETVTGGSATLRISNSTIIGNGGPASVVWGGIRQFGTSQILSRLTNTIEGNSVDEIGTIGTYSPR